MFVGVLEGVFDFAFGLFLLMGEEVDQVLQFGVDFGLGSILLGLDLTQFLSARVEAALQTVQLLIDCTNISLLSAAEGVHLGVSVGRYYYVLPFGGLMPGFNGFDNSYLVVCGLQSLENVELFISLVKGFRVVA